MSQNRLVKLPYLQFFSKGEEWFHDGPTERFGRFDILEKDMTEEFRDIVTTTSFSKPIDFMVDQSGRSKRIVINAKIISVQTFWFPEGYKYEYAYIW